MKNRLIILFITFLMALSAMVLGCNKDSGNDAVKLLPFLGGNDFFPEIPKGVAE